MSVEFLNYERLIKLAKTPNQVEKLAVGLKRVIEFRKTNKWPTKNSEQVLELARKRYIKLKKYG